MPEKETPFAVNETDKAVLVKRSDKKDTEGNVLEHGKVQVMKHATDAAGNHYGYFETEDGRIGHKKLSENYFGSDNQAELEALALERGDLTREQIEKEIRHEMLVEKASEDLAEEAFDEVGPGDPSEISHNVTRLTDAEWSAIRADRAARAIVEGAPTAPAQVIETTPAVEVAEREPKNAHLAKLFEPPVRPELPAPVVDSYDFMFERDEDKRAEMQAKRDAQEKENAPIKEAQKNFDRITNQDTREYSEQKLIAVMRHDKELVKLLADRGITEASLDAVDALRNDADLRYDVAVHFLKKLDKMVESSPGSFGARIVRNGEKSNDYMRLPVRTTSREYVAYLALAKISGMFNYKVDSSDVFQDVNDRNEIVLNQHRHATDMLI